MRKETRKVKERPTVSIIGAGRLGTALALALASRGYLLEALVTRRPYSSQKAARLLPHSALALSGGRLNELPPSKLILIATPDDVIGAVARKLAIAQKGMPGGRAVIHTSGALSSAVLNPLATTGFHTGSLHPLISVSDSQLGAASLAGAFYCLEGDAAAVRLARQLVRDLGGNSFTIEAKRKALYHAAAVMASGHLVALLDIAAEMLQRCGLDQKKAQRVLLPLVESSVKNLSRSGPARALTGTFARGDLATVKKHLAALAGEDNTDALAAYRLLGHRSLKLKQENGADVPVLKQIAKLLNQVPRQASKGRQR
jgi:predicted short-subunit dehydrogenase-like oxidoreductase (DUF2520 family)